MLFVRLILGLYMEKIGKLRERPRERIGKLREVGRDSSKGKANDKGA